MATRAETFSIQAKSYIASVNLLDSNQFDPDAKSCQAAMAAVVNCGTLNEDPQDGSKASGAYRLRSELVRNATCAAGKVSSWKFQPVQQDFGSEFVIFATSGNLAKPLTGIPTLTGSAPVNKVSFNYRLRGQPNSSGTAVMNAVKPRTCNFIWHEVTGTLTCQAGQLVVISTLIGSGFPSHRLWVQGKKVQNIPQGPFKRLWKCDSNDPNSVE